MLSEFMVIWFWTTSVPIGLIILCTGFLVNEGIVNPEDRTGYLTLGNPLYGTPKMFRGFVLAIVCVIYPPSLIAIIIKFTVWLIYSVYQVIIKKMKLNVCKVKIYPDGNVLTGCDVHVSPLATVCPICRKGLDK